MCGVFTRGEMEGGGDGGGGGGEEEEEVICRAGISLRLVAVGNWSPCAEEQRKKVHI